jgi:hypothetical protein
MKRKFMGEGLDVKAAERKAARIWNSKHKGKQAVHRGMA